MGSEANNRDFEGPARVEAEPQPIVRYDPPEGRGMVRITGRPGDIVDVLAEYQHMQQLLDKALPDCIMQIQGRQFRKKAYWRAVKTQFSLSTDITRTVFYAKYADGRTEFVQIDSDAQSVSIPGGDVADWGFIVYSKAVHGPTGINGPGMGACAMSEKASYSFRWENRQKVYDVDADGRRIIDEVKTADNATIHNVLSHAQTRSINRAIADLVGFGEVTADELHPRSVEPPDTGHAAPKSRPAPKAAPAASQAAPEGEELINPRKGFNKCSDCGSNPCRCGDAHGDAYEGEDCEPGDVHPRTEGAYVGTEGQPVPVGRLKEGDVVRAEVEGQDKNGWGHLTHVQGVIRASKRQGDPDVPLPDYFEPGAVIEMLVARAGFKVKQSKEGEYESHYAFYSSMRLIRPAPCS